MPTGHGRFIEPWTFVLIANTGELDGQVKVTLLFEDGSTSDRTFPVAGTSRFSVVVHEDFPQAVGRRFGVLVESVGPTPVPIVVERTMLWVFRAAGTNVVGTKLQ